MRGHITMRGEIAAAIARAESLGCVVHAARIARGQTHLDVQASAQSLNRLALAHAAGELVFAPLRRSSRVA
jgi:hypothetical protein